MSNLGSFRLNFVAALLLSISPLSSFSQSVQSVQSGYGKGLSSVQEGQGVLSMKNLSDQSGLDNVFINSKNSLYYENRNKVFIPSYWSDYFKNLDISENKEPLFSKIMSTRNVEIMKEWRVGHKDYVLIKFKMGNSSRFGLAVLNPDFKAQMNRHGDRVLVHRDYSDGIVNLKSGLAEISFVPSKIANKMRTDNNVDADLLRSLRDVLPVFNFYPDSVAKSIFIPHFSSKVKDSEIILGKVKFEYLSESLSNKTSSEQHFLQLAKRIKNLNLTLREDTNLLIASYNNLYKELLNADVVPGNYKFNLLKLNNGGYGLPFKSKTGFAYIVLLPNGSGLIEGNKSYKVVPFWFLTHYENSIYKSQEYMALDKVSMSGYAETLDSGLDANRYSFDKLSAESWLGRDFFPKDIDSLKNSSIGERDSFHLLNQNIKESSKLYILHSSESNNSFILQKASSYNTSKKTDSYLMWSVGNLESIPLINISSINDFRTTPRVISSTVAESLMKNELSSDYLNLVYLTASSVAVSDRGGVVSPSSPTADFAKMVFGDEMLKISIESQVERLNSKAEKYNEVVFSLNNNYFSISTEDKIEDTIKIYDFFKSKEIKDYKKRIF